MSLDEQFAFEDELIKEFNNRGMSAMLLCYGTVSVISKAGDWDLEVSCIKGRKAQVRVIHRMKTFSCVLGTTRPCTAIELINYIERYVKRYKKYGKLSKKEETIREKHLSEVDS